MNNLEIKKIRKELRLTQEMFAKKLNVSKSLVQKWESGERIPDEIIISLIKKIHNNTQNNTETSTVNEDRVSYKSTYDINIAQAEEKIKELEKKLKSNDSDLTELAIEQIKEIISLYFKEININLAAKIDKMEQLKEEEEDDN